jgi:lipooligosaccharide transport system ATP-binding protein
MHRSRGQVTGIGDRIEMLPDRILIYSSDGDADLDRIIAGLHTHPTSLVPSQASETCSCASPGGA